MHETRWAGLSRLSMGKGNGPPALSRAASYFSLLHWFGGAALRASTAKANCLYRRRRVGAAKKGFIRHTITSKVCWPSATATAASRARVGSSANAPRCFPTVLTFGASPTTGYGCLKDVFCASRVGFGFVCFLTFSFPADDHPPMVGGE